ncbi:RNA polymerase factor sigma-54 [Altererythrobacter sp. ZODW24]|uniref:RNA polymerase factor sigma-54 n=1 Tax=Altererythrobacter sp. ZODW24 TaxID=2185142 RepID=UPI000DF7545E|nr:RNA polymerase factor sigma-54 [Altererythrobacter sp. ZODW24]
MALGPRLDLRQSQSLVMTPQLQQAIKLLALSNLEIEAFIGDALESNPLLEAGETRDRAAEEGEMPSTAEESSTDSLLENGLGEGDRPLDVSPEALHGDKNPGDAEWGSAASSGGSIDVMSIDERGEGDITLAQHLEEQVGTVATTPKEMFIARHLIGQLDEAGYVATDLREITRELNVELAQVESALVVIQSCDPTGVGARTLSECLALQAREADRHDPCMARLIENLDLVAKGSFAQLRRMCDVDDEDFADMLNELRGYDPKPGLRFSSGGGESVVPDVLIKQADDDGWDISLNQATLPRLVVNRSYYVELREGCQDKESKAWLGEKLTDANWLLKALDQRQKTILKVAAEIVKRQDGFFRQGVSALKPLTLKVVADEIEMHESTVSRVTSNKYLHCDRGTYELKYFFTSGVGSSDGGGDVSAETVKAEIRNLVDGEDPKKILSDDKLVELLKDKGFDLARRTVAKYREAIGIGSSVQRRRQKKLEGMR